MFIIADAHISSNLDYMKFMKIVSILKKYDKVILLGDIIDFTKVEISKLNLKVKDFEHENIIYIKGNHDIIIDELDIPTVDRCGSDKGIHFEHGHRFEARLSSNFFINAEDYNNLFKKLCYGKSNINTFSNWLWCTRLKLFNSMNKYKFENSEMIFREMNKIENIICGHSHFEIFHKPSKTLLLSDYKSTKKIYYINESEYLTKGKYKSFSVLAKKTEDIEKIANQFTSL